MFCFYFSPNEEKPTSVLSAHLSRNRLEVDRNKISVFLSTIPSFMFTCSYRMLFPLFLSFKWARKNNAKTFLMHM